VIVTGLILICPEWPTLGVFKSAGLKFDVFKLAGLKSISVTSAAVKIESSIFPTFTPSLLCDCAAAMPDALL
jgi:hypothetical protein